MRSLWASFSPGLIPQSYPDPSSASLPFFGHMQTSQCFSFKRKEPTTAHGTQGVALPVLNTGEQVMIPFLAMWAHTLMCSCLSSSTLRSFSYFWLLFLQPVMLQGLFVTQVQDLALSLIEPCTVGHGPSIWPVQILLQSLHSLQQINTFSQLVVICKQTEDALHPPHPVH